MHILFESSLTDEIKDRYVVLPLDTFYFESTGHKETAYCVVETKSIDQMTHLDKWQNLHCKLIENYQKQNWKFCEDALEHLAGAWGGELDSFYRDIANRVSRFKDTDLGTGWTGVRNKP